MDTKVNNGNKQQPIYENGRNKAKMLKHNLSSYERYNIYHSIDEDSVNKSLEEGDLITPLNVMFW